VTWRAICARPYAVDADHMVDWDDVVLVEAGSAEPLKCPICFDEPPVCPQVTLCGHAFCFPCIARHALTNRKDGEPAKCPMCFTPVRLADLRGIRRRPIAPPVVAESGGAAGKAAAAPLRMTLLARHRDSTVPAVAARGLGATATAAAAAGGAWPRSGPDGACDTYAKYTLTSDEGVGLGRNCSPAI